MKKKSKKMEKKITLPNANQIQAKCKSLLPNNLPCM